MVDFDRERRIQDAKDFIAEGNSEALANVRFEIPQSTLSHRLHGSKSRSEAQSNAQICGRAPAKKQVNRFIERHDKIYTKKERVMPRERLEARNRDDVHEFFPLLAQIRAKYNIQPENEYNMDETGVQEGE
ncbi:hypothetical protein DL764_006641 [Monosporascus ibericus]|uniref:HTH psq-type domain-containing protein n=1 Tax=Monosporascus ibericus TaxID=155417 RepID=A0A4Q4T4B5_9PEZI|nr:hypothetical protein DL764_006641 [Monosporascus ibericus]